MHPLLQRQMKRHLMVEGLDVTKLASFLEAVNAAYLANEQDRQLIERSIDLTSSELMQRNQQLVEKVAELQHARDELMHVVATLDSTLESRTDGLILFDNEGRILRHNRIAYELLDLNEQWLKEHNQSDLCHQLSTRVYNPEQFIHNIAQIACGDTQFDCKLHDERTLRVTARTYRIGDQPVGHICLFSDITELNESKLTAEFLANYDALTHLPNRQAFLQYLARHIETDTRQHARLALVLVDLDAFHSINESLGHDYGDQLLRVVTERLIASTHENDFVARLSADEFAVVTLQVLDKNDAYKTALAIQAQLSNDLLIKGHELKLSACIGVACFPDDGDSVDALVRHAEMALSVAKEKGKQQIQLFDAALEAGIIYRSHLERLLRLAVRNNEMFLHYQPKIRLSDSKMIGCEALLRWIKQDGNAISPVDFIPVAERIGVIAELGEFALQSACRQQRLFRDAGYQEFAIAVNLSAVQLRDPQLVKNIRHCVHEFGLTAQDIELEVTESMLMQDADSAAELLRELAALGFHLAVDDFGTGYSSLSYLSRFPLHSLKIDRAFTRNLPHAPDQVAIATAIIALAHNLNMRVIAEGVEDNDALQALIGWQCDVVQGYYFSKPVAADILTHLLQLQREAGQFVRLNTSNFK